MKQSQISSADGAVAETVQAAQAMKEDMSKVVQGAGGVLRGVVHDASALARNGIERARETGQRVRVQVSEAGDKTVTYIREEPVKSVLIAAAVGAASAGLIAWLARSRSRSDS
jgi:ElaB/YqjD/DUF883 family membrane-anchored ribosome-binding protein